ncbi:type II toxin-antitoxin system HicB family antitoxin [Streptomyces sp. NPDC056580]|uniref:type II toxin-antitoxin system HicB family antitoxin n=1 Tax=Streptomyces sp. NPDC056580 TaxID=3345872 RepID=UPI0036B3FECC
MSTYRVVARRTGDWWALEVPDLPGVFSQAKRLAQADEAAREAIAVMLDVEPEDVAVEIETVLPKEAQDALTAMRLAQDEAQRAAERERLAMQRAAAVLTKELSQRDAGRFLGVSFQRVHQLLQSYKSAGSKSADVRGSKTAESQKTASRSKTANRPKAAA